MNGLPQPALPPGAHRDLVERLHDLHHRAGWPSLRAIAADVGCSPTTASAVFSRPRLPSWGRLELIVERLGGDPEEFHRLWLAASAAPGRSTHSAALAGRQTELTRLRSHLRDPSGQLLLVAGEAGIGKSRLVAAARATVNEEVAVLIATSFPQASPVPLMAVADLIRAAIGFDDGQWVKEALAAAPDFVAAEVHRLVPELQTVAPAATSPGETSPHRLFAALRRFLLDLGDLRPTALVLEDVHWADPVTQEFAEHLLTLEGGLPVPMVATWRHRDPDTPVATTEWMTRIRRHPGSGELILKPLTLGETREQIMLLRLDPDAAGWIHRRAGGNPLYVELLAKSGDPAALPDLLADILDQCLSRLSDEAARAAHTLAAVGHPLTTTQLRQALHGPDPLVASTLRELLDRDVARQTDQHIHLSHPLLAEALTRRLGPDDAADVHRSVANAMVHWPSASPGAVAQHWQAANDPAQELRWRVRASRAATARLAAGSAADEWTRALELWSAVDDAEGVGGLADSEVQVEAMDALHASGRAEEATAIARAALERAGDLPAPQRGRVLRRVGLLVGITSPDEGLRILTDAVSCLESAPPTTELARSLDGCAGLSVGLGRLQDADRFAARAIAAAEKAAAPSLQRRLLARRAWQALSAGDIEGAWRDLDTISRTELSDPDPWDEIWVGVAHTDVLLLAGRPADEVVAAAEPGLTAAETWQIRDFFAHLLRSNVVEALIRAGRSAEAVRLVHPVRELPLDRDSWSLHADLARLCMLDGRLDEAQSVFGWLDGLDLANAIHRISVEEPAVECALWRGQPAEAWSRASGFLHHQASGDVPRFAAGLQARAARAAADLAQASAARASPLEDELRRLAAEQTPFDRDIPGDSRAWGATWAAELERLRKGNEAQAWLAAIRLWDRLQRPHEAAYCRWRLARALRPSGPTSAVLRLLARAERDARHHAPLLHAVRRDAARGR